MRFLYKRFCKNIYISDSIITSERSERISHQQSYIGHPDEYQTALKTSIKIEKKIKYNFIRYLGTDKSFKIISQRIPT